MGKNKKVSPYSAILAERAQKKAAAKAAEETGAAAADKSNSNALTVSTAEKGDQRQPALRGKILIEATLRLETGLHIGMGGDFAPIGAVDAPFIRDPVTRRPIVPGSSIKGKLRTLLARSFQEGYWLDQIDKDPEPVKALFGAANNNGSARAARLQFFDCHLTEESFERLKTLEFHTYLGEVKWENTIDRLTGGASPRQIERTPAGAEFAFRVAYSIEREEETERDMKLLADGLRLLQLDYLGGSGSRGYGRVSLRRFQVTPWALDPEKIVGV